MPQHETSTLLPVKAEPTKKPRGRSPSYPGIDLERALNLVRVIYEHQGKHAAPADLVCQQLGMKPRTGTSTVVVSALRKFGLIDHSTDGVKLSALALDVLLDERPDSEERAEKIREAALKPSIHSELWTRYEGKLPADPSILRFYLTRQRGFTENGADDLVQEFRRTLSFANLKPSEVLSDLSGDKMVDREGQAMGATATQVKPPTPAPALPLAGQGSQGQEIHFTIPGPLSVTITAPRPLSAELWTQMTAILNAMRPTVVEPEPKPEPKKGS